MDPPALNVRVRAGGRSDLPAIAGLVRALARYEGLAHQIDWTQAELGESLFGPEAVARVLLAEPEPGAVPVGLAIWYPTYSTFFNERGIWVEDLFVLEEHRGRGVGTALLEELFRLAGDGRVEWAVLDWNRPAIAFYESMGARPVDGWKVYRWRRQEQRRIDWR